MKFHVYIWGSVNDVLFRFRARAAPESFSRAVFPKTSDILLARGGRPTRSQAVVEHTDRSLYATPHLYTVTAFCFLFFTLFQSRQRFTLRVKSKKSKRKVHVMNYLKPVIYHMLRFKSQM